MIKEMIKKLIPWINQDKKIYRIYLKASNQKNKHIANYYSYKILKKYNCYISSKSKIGKNIVFPHPTGIVIGEGVKIGENCVIYQNVTIGRKHRNKAEYPKIGNNVIIYANSVIIGNVNIGNNVTIGCNSVVLRDVKDGEIVMGIVK